MTRRRITRAAAAGLALATALALWVGSADVPGFADVRAAARGSEATLLDRHGAPLQTLRLDHAARQLPWVPLSATSPALVRTLVRAEDRRFRLHPGVDPLAVGAALVDNVRRDRARGASTLTMQLATLLAESAGGAGNKAGTEAGTQAGTRRSPWRTKLAQARLALAIETRWSKDEILEAYLNLAPFRGELRGIGAAAAALFGKSPAGLDRAESAVLVAMLPSPGASAARIAARACRIAGLAALPASAGDAGDAGDAVDAGDAPRANANANANANAIATDCDRTAFIVAALGRRHPLPGQHDDAPHLARRLLARAGDTVRSTLDAPLQRHAREALREQLRALAGHGAEDGALVVLDNASGDVLAWVGSSGELSDAPAVDGVLALRQPGSTLKPFLYALAIESGWLTAASVLDDSPLAIATPTGLYLPQNYDREFRGRVTVRNALAGSLNVPAVRALTLAGLPRFHERLRALGFGSLANDAEHYGYGLALGGAEVDLLSLANAYRTLANGGRWTPVRLLQDAPSTDEARQVVDPRAAFIVGDILADRGARAGTFGVASPLDTRGRAAVKTGTSKAMRDNWAVGYTDRFTVAVWVGNFSGAPMRDVSGVTGAAPVLRVLLDHLHDASAAAEPAPPEGLVRATTRFPELAEPARSEWYLAGTEMKEVRPAPRTIAPRIVAPARGAIVAIDPDIPPARQSLRVEVAGAVKGICMRLDATALPECDRSVYLLSMPAPGFHKFTLHDAAGRALDTVAIEVRGIPRAGVAASGRAP